MQRRYLAILGFLVVLSFGATAHATRPPFEQWLESFKATAKAQGIAPAVVDNAFDGIREDEEVVRLDRKQPEDKIDLTRYLKNTVTDRRIALGRELLAEHRELLNGIAQQYGVQPHYIIALWGIETDFGNYTGNFSVIQSLTTLAYEGRRHEFFSKELIAALKIMERENIPADAMIGSWAGAMGHCQFMPSTYLKFAVDGDGDGSRDIWNSRADIFSSIANYLHSLDWNPHKSWGGAVATPKKFKPSAEGIKHGKTATEWRKHGFASRNGRPKLDGDAVLYAIYPGSNERGVFLVTENYKALLQWNRSRYFATAVGTLADAIGDQP